MRIGKVVSAEKVENQKLLKMQVDTGIGANSVEQDW